MFNLFLLNYDLNVLFSIDFGQPSPTALNVCCYFVKLVVSVKMGRLRKMGHLCDGRSGKLARLDEMDSLGKMGHSLKMEATRHEMFHVDGGILV